MPLAQGLVPCDRRFAFYEPPCPGRRFIRSTKLVGERYSAVHLEAARTAAAAELQDIERVRDATVDGDCHGWRRTRRRTWRGGRCHGWILTDLHVERLRRHSREPIVDGLPDLSVVVDLLAPSPIPPAGGKPRPIAGRVRDHVQHHPPEAALAQPERDAPEQDASDPALRSRS